MFAAQCGPAQGPYKPRENLRTLLQALLFWLFMSVLVTPVHAENSPSVAVLEVHGIVCSFCAYGAQKRLSKLPFVDPSRYIKGVEVKIEDQRVTLALQPNAKFDPQATWEAVREAGYEPAGAVVTNSDGSVTHYNAEGAPCTGSC